MAAFNPLLTPIDQAILNGVLTPGLCRIQHASDPRRWDERQGYGVSGSFAVYYGSKLAHFDMIIRLFSDGDWTNWDSFRSIVARPPAGQRPQSISIWHPWLQMLGIKSVGVEDLQQPEETDDTGGYQITIPLIEWRTPKLTLSKPTATKTPEDTDPVHQKLDADAKALAARLAKG